MTLSEELLWRGFINQTTLQDITVLDKEPISFYWGVDPSADSMHIGQLAMAMMIRHFINYGHKATLLVGGATGMIGDPDGKDAERELKSLEEIVHNKTSIAAQYRTIFNGLDFDIVDNYDWFKNIGYLQFLRDIGKHFSMTQLLDRDFVQNRIGAGSSGISYAEFSYSLIQGYDFLHLYREYGVTLQVAGADQWGNSISGVHLLRKLEDVDAHVWTAPLIINKATGKKFGKSEAGAVWLDDTKTSAYQLYQFWLNVDDEGAIDYAKIYTLLSKEEVDDLERQHKASPGARIAQKTLAREVTALVHGEKRRDAVERVTEVLFNGSSIHELSEEDLSILAREIPAVDAGGTLVDILTQAGIVSSNGEARRLIVGGAISVNNEKVSKDTSIHALSLIKKGKNTFVLAR
ncbi:MAG TPA: tyrosine--tRNA ligase [Candidatus Saccharimonadales bacterium]|nr:tyrosine--tRNA ligase [Candidatus Saccharimonadales bacterium]